MKDIIGKMACGSAGRLVSACAVLVSALSARAVEIDLCAARITVENRENGTQARAAEEFIAAAERLKAFRIRHVKDMREAWTMLFSDKRLERPLWHRVRGAHRSGKLQPSASL